MISFCEDPRRIDVYTQKVPFDGKGIDQSSDAFAPQELVILYANVTYNEAPVANKLVSFQANNPPNAFQNMTVVGSSITNGSGIAQFSFRVPWPTESPEQIVFGEWTVLASVEIAEAVIMDTLTFKVGWIIKITNIATFNSELAPQTKYLRGEGIVFDLALENIALIPKSGVIIIDAQDASSYPIIHIELDNLVFQPGENHVQGSSQIPTDAIIGQAKVTTAAYNASPSIGGALYSPAAFSTFEIIVLVPSEGHDVAVINVSVLSSTAYIGDPIEVTVEVINLGKFTETFNASIHYDSFRIATQKVWSLGSGLSTTLIFTWDTSGASAGTYVIWAFAEFVPGEVNVLNNIFTNGKVTLLSKPPTPMHDVAVLSVSPSKTLAYIGEIVYVYVDVKNEGAYPESFNVTAFYNSNVIATQFVNSLQPGSEMPLTFCWNTLNVTEGSYTLSAEASTVLGELNVENNRFVDDVVWVKPSMFPSIGVSGWLLAILFLLAVIIGACLIFAIAFSLLRRRKRKRKDQIGPELRSPEAKRFKEMGPVRSKTCSACGKEFSEVHTFCPYCFTFHGKDYK
jgi:hypothetical protein